MSHGPGSSTEVRSGAGLRLGPERVTLLAFALSAIAFFWIHRFPPMDDYPNWLYQGRIFGQLISGREAPAGFSLVRYPVPNAVATSLIGLAGAVIGIAAAGKLMLTVCILSVVLGSAYITMAFTRGRLTPVGPLAALYALNRNFWKGEMSFSFGLGILLLAMGYMLRRERAADAKGWAVPDSRCSFSSPTPSYSMRG